ncbi:MAG: hypothetical protein IPJ77_00765 [Planctomycetes bacterium]|nr:hypothetical protein [Planctomycetota bacterium]
MFLAFLLSLPTLAGDPIAEAPLVTRSYDLSGVFPRSATFRAVEFLFPHVVALFDASQDSSLQESEPAAPEVLIDLIQQQFPAEFDAEGRRLWIANGPRILVRAPEDVQPGVLQLVQNTEALFASSMELQVDVVRAPTANVTTGSLAVADAEALLAAAGGERSTYRVDLAPGVPALLDLSGTKEFVADYNVEIAQAASIFDPIVATIATGVRLQAYAAPAPGGTWLALSLRASQPSGELRDVPFPGNVSLTTQDGVLRGSTPRSVQSARLQSRSLALNVFLADGKALVLRTGFDLATGRDDACFVLRMHGKPLPREFRLGPVGKPGAPELRAFALGFARPPTQSIESDGILSTLGNEGSALPMAFLNDQDASVRIALQAGAHDEVLDVLRDEYPDFDFGDWGGWMLVRPNDPSQPPTAAQLDAIGASLARLAPSPRLFQIGLTLRRGGEKGAVLARAVLASRAGEPAVAVLGMEETRVFDLNVEVAQSASAADPVVGSVFEGLAVEARPLPGLAGETRLLLHARARVQRGAARDFEANGDAIGALELADYDQLLFDERLAFKKDGPRTVRLGDLGTARARSRSRSS